MEIKSLQNALIKDAKKLQQRKYRDEKGLFLVEGIRLVEEAWKAGWLETVFYEDGLAGHERGQALYQMMRDPARVSGPAAFRVTAAIIKNLAETGTPQGVVAVAKRKTVPAAGIGRNEASLILICDGLQDPGNLGAMIRTAWAVGVEAIFCLPGTADPYSGKTVRAAMGGVFHVPLVTDLTWPETLKWCRDKGYLLAAGDPKAETEYSAARYAEKTALVIGNEGGGLLSVRPEELDLRVRIPLAVGAESLNAAVATGILLYEIARQRKELRQSLSLLDRV